MISQILFLSVQVIHKPAKKRLCETIRLCEMMLYGNIFPILFFLGLLFFINSAFQTKSNSIHKEVLFFFPSFPALNDALSQSSSFKVTVTVYKQALAL